jgi:Chalcone isomerase-like
MVSSGTERVGRSVFLGIAGWIVLSGAFAFAGAESGAERTVEGVSFPLLYEGEGFSLRLHNAALLRYKIVFRGYVVALYLPDGADPASALGPLPKRLEFSYFWKIPGPEFGKAGEEILTRNVDRQTVTALRERLDSINRAYKDVKPGDRYALTYRPGKGTELSFNGKPLVLVEGDDFAAAYFSIWLGKKPIDEDLKNELLRRG